MSDEQWDHFMADVQEKIDKFGFTVIGVGASEETRQFVYTVGLTEHGFPEFIAIGLPIHVGYSALQSLGTRVYDTAQRFTDGQKLDDPIVRGVHDEVYNLWIRHVRIDEEYRPGAAITRYGRDRIPMLYQVCWPDKANRPPWDPDYAIPYVAQPMLAGAR